MKNKNPFGPETSYHQRFSSYEEVYTGERAIQQAQGVLDCTSFKFLMISVGGSWEWGGVGLVWKHRGRLVELMKDMIGDTEDI